MNSRLLILALIGGVLFSCEVTAVCEPGSQGPGGVCNCTNAPGWTEGNWYEPWCHQGTCFTKMKKQWELCMGKPNGTGLGDKTWCWKENRSTRCPTILEEEKVFLCSSRGDCGRNSKFCDFSSGDSGTCVFCPPNGTDCDSYLPLDNEKGLQACKKRCEWTDWTPPARTTKKNNFKKTQSTTSQMTQSIWKKIYSNMKFHHNSLKSFISEFSWLLCSFQGDFTQKLISWNALRLNY